MAVDSIEVLFQFFLEQYNETISNALYLYNSRKCFLLLKCNFFQRLVKYKREFYTVRYLIKSKHNVLVCSDKNNIHNIK